MTFTYLGQGEFSANIANKNYAYALNGFYGFSLGGKKYVSSPSPTFLRIYGFNLFVDGERRAEPRLVGQSLSVVTSTAFEGLNM